jgi:hypothetical protein
MKHGMGIAAAAKWKMSAKRDAQLHHIAAGIITEGRLLRSQLDTHALRRRLAPALRASGVTVSSPIVVRSIMAVRTAIAVRAGSVARVVFAGWAGL